jgi:hypothetical protein
MTALVASLILLTTAATAHAATVSPREDRAMIRISDFGNHYGHVTRSYTEDLGKDRRPTACENPVDGHLATPAKAAKKALLKEIAFPANVIWQNTAFFYPSSSAAHAAFREMAAEAIKYCNMRKVINVGTDAEVVKARVSYDSRMLAPVKGVSRLAVSYAASMLSSASPSAAFADSYDYSVYALKDNVITRVGVGQVAPNAPLEKSDAETTALAVASRLTRLGA